MRGGSGSIVTLCSTQSVPHNSASIEQSTATPPAEPLCRWRLVHFCMVLVRAGDNHRVNLRASLLSMLKPHNHSRFDMEIKFRGEVKHLGRVKHAE